MLLAPGADSEAQKPTWDAYNPDQVRKKVDLSALRAQQAQEQSTYFDISPNAPGAGGAQDSTYFDIGACARPPLCLCLLPSPSAAPSAAPSACVFSRAGRARSLCARSVHLPGACDCSRAWCGACGACARVRAHPCRCPVHCDGTPRCVGWRCTLATTSAGFLLVRNPTAHACTRVARPVPAWHSVNSADGRVSSHMGGRGLQAGKCIVQLALCRPAGRHRTRCPLAHRTQ